jgi:putative membrane protein
MKYKQIATAAALTIVGTVGFASAKEVLGMGTPNAQQFRHKMLSNDAFEIESSKIALSHATKDSIKSFANMMVSDHARTREKLIALGGISKKSIQTKMVPGRDGKYSANDLFDSDQAADLNNLVSKSNDDFNKFYIDEQVEHHKDAVSLLESYGNSGDNPKLKTLAQETLPTVQRHLTLAQTLDRQLDNK